MFNEFIKNFIIILLSKILQNENLYFTLFLDFRLRLYMVGYPLNIIGGSEILREYLKFNPKNGLEFNSISLDATCSGISIIAGLVGSIEVLQLTNVLETQDNTEKQDFYTKISNIMSQKWAQIKITKIKCLKTLNILRDLVDQIIPDRNFVKLFCLKFSYNETAYTRIQNVSDKLTTKWVGEHEMKIPEKEIHFISVTLEKIFVESISGVCPDLIDFRDLFNKNLGKAIKRNNGLYINNVFGSIYTHKPQIEMKRITRYANNKPQQFTVSKNKEDTDVGATRRAALANFIHSLDAEILHRVVEMCRLNDINVSTVHDCF